MSHTTRKKKRSRPELLVELPGLGTVDPFGLRLDERPTGDFHVRVPGRAESTRVERAGISLVGAGRALLGLSMSWMEESRSGTPPDDFPLEGEMHFVVRRREAQLLAALLRRHIGRLPQAPPWMGRLQRSLEEYDEYLRWEDP